MKFIGRYPTYGEVVGIIKLDTVELKVPGNVGKATSYNFHVKYKIVKKATVERLEEKNDPVLLNMFIDTAKELEKEG